MTVAVDDDDVQEIEVAMDNGHTYNLQDEVGTGEDEFSAKIEDIRKMDGLSLALKRKSARMQKFAGQRDEEAYQTGIRGSKQIEVQYANGYSLFDVVVPPYNPYYLARVYEISAPHFAAVNAKVSNIVGLGYNWIESPKTAAALEKISNDEQKVAKVSRKLQATKVELDNWIDSLNDIDTFTETLMKVYIDLEVTGNGYLEIGRDVEGRIKYLGHIPCVSVRIRRQRDGFVQIIGNRAVFFRNFGDKKTKDQVGNDPNPNEIIHFKKYTPNNSYYGIPDIMAAKNALAGNEFSARFNLDYFEHKAAPRYVIVVKGAKLSAQSQQKMIAFFSANLKGKSHRTLYIPLPGEGDGGKIEFEMKPVETGIQDASFGNYRIMNRDDILMAHRVPLTKISVSADGATLAIARDADKTFKEQVCRPAQDIVEKKLNKIIAEKTDVFTLGLNEFTLTDEIDQAKIDQIYLTTQVIVPNEVRKRKGLPNLKGGDKPYQPTPQQAADQKATTTQSRTRDQTRAANRTDSAGQPRNPKGEGRTTA